MSNKPEFVWGVASSYTDNPSLPSTTTPSSTNINSNSPNSSITAVSSDNPSLPTSCHLSASDFHSERNTGYQGYPQADNAWKDILDKSDKAGSYENYINLSYANVKQFDDNGNFIGSLWGIKCKHPLDVPDSIGNSCELSQICIPRLNIDPSLTTLLDGLIGTDSVTCKTIDEINRLADDVDKVPEAKLLIKILSDNYKEISDDVKNHINSKVKALILDYQTLSTPERVQEYSDLEAYLNAPFPELKLKEDKDTAELDKLLNQLDDLNLEDIDIPIINPCINEITERQIHGNGIFDHIGSAIFNQLDYIHNKGLINKDDLANIYSNVLVQGIQTSIQYGLEKHNIVLQSYQAKVAAAQASVAILEAKTRLLMLPSQLRLAYAQIEAQLQQIELLRVQIQLEKEKYPQLVAQTDLILAQTDAQRLNNEQIQVGIQTSKLGIEQTKEQIALMQEQNKQAKIQTEVAKLQVVATEEQIKSATLSNNKLIEDTKMVDAQTQLQLKQVELADIQKVQAKAQIKALAQQAEREKENLGLIKAQAATSLAQLTVLKEQIKAAKAQYSDTIDGKSIGGVIGAQIAVNRAQSMAFERSSFINFVNQLQSGWSAKKTADIATISPNGFNGLAIDRVLTWGVTNYFNMPKDTFRMPKNYSDYLTDKQLEGDESVSSANPVKEKEIKPND